MRIYLDNNATTAIDPQVASAMSEALLRGPQNPDSPHQQGRDARARLIELQDRMATLAGLPDYRTYFIPSATLALQRTISLLAGESGVVAHSTVEHPAVMDAPIDPERRLLLPVDQAWRVEVPSADTQPVLCVAMLANNETGALLDLRSLADWCCERKVPLLVDASQCPGRMDLVAELQALRPALLVLCAHKMHGPVGVACLLTAPGVLQDETDTAALRCGTPSLPLAEAMMKAFDLSVSRCSEQRLNAWGERLRNAILQARPDAQFTLKPDQSALAGVLHFRLPGIPAERVLITLDLAGISCSSASACMSGAQTPSHVLLALGFDAEGAREGVRLAPSRLNTEAEIAVACEILAKVLPTLKSGGRAQ